MRPVCLARSEVITGFGDGTASLWQGAMAGQRAFAPVDRFDTSQYLADQAACVPGLTPGQDGSLAAPLLDRLLERLGDVPDGTRVLTATTKGAIDLLEAGCRQKPVTPAKLPLGVAGERVAHHLGLKAGPNVSAACASSTIALARGAEMIARGGAEAVLVVCFDLMTEFVFSGFSSLQALSPESSRPFDRERNGLTLGEGAAALLLIAPEMVDIAATESPIWLRGWGVASDATHITAPARDGRGLVAAVDAALSHAGIDVDQVAGISAHGTGTRYNDAMELTAFRRLFGDRTVPIHSLKGAIGHTLGAAGGIEAALAKPILKQRRLPPTAGLTVPEDGGGGRVSAKPQALQKGCLLSTNSGFGGINAALLFSEEAP